MSEEWTDEERAAMKVDVEKAMTDILAKHVLRKCLKDNPLFGMLAEGWGDRATATFANGGVVNLKDVI